MIPRTFPSTFASNGQQQMVVHFLTSVEGLERWSDYIPVKLEQGGPENSYSGCIDVVAISDLTADTQAWKEYTPVYADSSATDSWTVNTVGYIPYNYALFAEAAMQLDLTNGASLDPRVTFDRTTNATVTGPDGLIAYAPHNLLTFSEQFDNAAWGKLNATVTANTSVAPDGTTTADTLVVTDTANVRKYAQQTLTPSATPSEATVFSVFARAGTYGVIQLSQTADAQTFVNFNISTGTVGTAGTKTTGSIIDAGNGWYRCIAAFNASSVYTFGSLRVSLQGAATDGFAATTTVTGTVLLWGAQLEISSTATSYNPTTVKNLLGFTEHFDNAAWTKSNATISATKVDDIYGQPFAQKLVEAAVSGVHVLFQDLPITSGTRYTQTIYAKAAERTVLQIATSTGFAGAGESFQNYNLSNGTLGGSVGSGVASIADIGNGWYRCQYSVPANLTTSGRMAFYIVTSDSASRGQSYTGDGTSGIYIFGAQFSDSASVDPYVYQPVAAPTSTAYYGPRFDYDPVTLAPKGLLIEEQRVNLLLSSQAFATTWSKVNITVLDNALVSPDGQINASLVTTTTASDYVQQGVTVVSGTTYTLTTYAKADTSTGIGLVFLSTNSAFPLASVNFDLVAGTATPDIGTLVAYGITSVGNGWYRCSATLAATASAQGFIRIVSTSADAISTYALWGAQLEAGSFATSYIPTVASQVTRAADSASMIGNNFARWYRQDEGTVLIKVDAKQLSNVKYLYTVSDSTSSNVFGVRSSSNNTYDAVRTSNGVTTDTSNTPTQTNDVYSAAVTYDMTQISLTFTGDSVRSVSSSAPGQLTALNLGSLRGIGSYLNGSIQRFAYYNRRLANTELQAITS